MMPTIGIVIVEKYLFNYFNYKLFAMKTMLYFILAFGVIFIPHLGTAQSLSFEEPVVLFEYPIENLQAEFSWPYIPVDHDQDGDIDFFGSSFIFDGQQIGGQYLYKNDGNGAFESIQVANLETENPLRATDFDEDGDLDIITKKSVYSNEGNDEFTRIRKLDDTRHDISEIHDLNQDGINDLIVHDRRNETIMIIYNVDCESTRDTIMFENDEEDVGGLVIGDIEADGDVDIVYNVHTGGRNFAVVLYNEGSGFRQEKFPEHYQGSESSMALIDLDMDGDLDLLLADRFDLKIFEFDNGSFEEVSEIGLRRCLFYSTADLDNDNDLDLILTLEFGDFNRISYMLNSGNFEFADTVTVAEYVTNDFATTNLNQNYSKQNVNVVDYNNDGNMDITYTDGYQTPSRLMLLLNNSLFDADNDGFTSDVDCDDNNPDINPDAEEIPNNGIDEDCDQMDLLSSTYELANSTINIYPNPATDIINIDVDGELSYQAKLYNINGQFLKTMNNDRQLEVTTIPKGIYMLEIQDLNSSQKIIERILIEK